MAARSERDWLESARVAILRGDLSSAQRALGEALREYPQSADLLRARAGVFQQTGDAAAAEAALLALLARDPGDAGSAFALVRTLKERGRTAAAAAVLRACCETGPNSGNPDLAISAIELLGDIDRRREAAEVAERAVAGNPDDPRLRAYAGMLAIQLGEFERARAHYVFALQHEPRAVEWHVPIGLSSTLRYADGSHPDFALFRDALNRDALSDLARAELHFSLGKACDDIGDPATAAHHFREGNAIRHRQTPWSRKGWRRAVTARLSARRTGVAAAPTPGFTPVFIVGMPRTGTTLLAGLLSRHPAVCNRGELTILAGLAQRASLNGTPDRGVLERAAAEYARQSRQDDAPDARFFIDKQPLNFRYVDLALALFPDARIVHCRRCPRDTALSLWMQCFLEDVQGYAYAFRDIDLVMRDERRLMEHWQSTYPEAVVDVRYEDLVASPRESVAALARRIGLPSRGTDEATATALPTSTISTASLWQARQPVNTRSVCRWKAYADNVPELLRFAET